jgi:hypothetical protein
MRRLIGKPVEASIADYGESIKVGLWIYRLSLMGGECCDSDDKACRG